MSRFLHLNWLITVVDYGGLIYLIVNTAPPIRALEHRGSEMPFIRTTVTH